jgi:hypothetical protein
MAKLNRESRLREKRADKQARKAARKSMAASDSAHAASPSDEPDGGLDGLDPDPSDGADQAAVAAGSGRYDR